MCPLGIKPKISSIVCSFRTSIPDELGYLDSSSGVHASDTPTPGSFPDVRQGIHVHVTPLPTVLPGPAIIYIVIENFLPKIQSFLLTIVL